MVLDEGFDLLDDYEVEDLTSSVLDDDSRDVVFRIECRNAEGDRYPERDLELEIFRSGREMNLILSWRNKAEYPLLWQGRHAVWMDSISGKRCSTPKQGLELESLARRLQALIVQRD